MRITQMMNQAQFMSAMTTLESNLSKTQNQIATNLAFTTPSENPVAAGAVDHYNQALSQSKQYDVNASSAQTRLGTEDNVLSQVQAALQSLRDMALQANSGTLSLNDRAGLATQATQIQASLVALANTQDGNGEYLFGGFTTQTPPFAATSTGAAYSGDTGQRLVQIAAGQTVPDGDNGATVFNQIKTGNGTFTTAPAAANTGSGLVGATSLSDPTVYDGKPYSIKFSLEPASPVTVPPGAPVSSYTVLDAADNPVVDAAGDPVAPAAYTSGQAINYGGRQVTLSGQPAVGDKFVVAPSTNQSVFTTIQNLVTALQSTGGTAASTEFSNSMGDAINNLDQALSQTSIVRTSVGGRLNAITTQLSVASSQQIQLQASISSLQSLDYASALTKLSSQNVTLSAAMQAYTLTQNLSLFKYLPAG